MTNRDNLHAKVRAILEKANHPNTPQAEAETALALAFRLMQKYDIDESSISKRTYDNETVMTKTFVITGQYRVRRGTLLWNIANAVSCHTYRDMMEPNPTQVIMVAFGTENDLFSLEALYTAADLLAARSIPSGDRRFKTSWWRGYCEAIGAKLAQEHQTMVKEAPGVGLVLLERAERARRFMVQNTPHLHSSTSNYRSDREAFGAGHRAGQQFSSGRNSFGNSSRQIGAGSNG